MIRKLLQEETSGTKGYSGKADLTGFLPKAGQGIRHHLGDGGKVTHILKENRQVWRRRLAAPRLSRIPAAVRSWL